MDGQRFDDLSRTLAGGDFSGEFTIVVAQPASVVDNEIVFQGASFTEHQYIQSSFVPCDVC